MANTCRPYTPEEDFLLPPSLRDWLPENYLAHFLSDVVDLLDLSSIEWVYEAEERGYLTVTSETQAFNLLCRPKYFLLPAHSTLHRDLRAFLRN